MTRLTFALPISLSVAVAMLLALAASGHTVSTFAGEPTALAGETEVPADTPIPTNTTAPTDTPAPTNTTAPTNTPAPTNTTVPTNTVEASETPDDEATQTAIAEEEEEDGDGGDSDNDWLLWLLLAIGALVVIGAIAAFIMARNRSADAEAAAIAADEREAWSQDARLTYGKASSLHADLRTGIAPAAGAAAMSDDLEWLNRQNSRLDEVGFELGRLASSATNVRDRNAVESLSRAVGEMRGVIQQRLSPTGFATPADYQQSLTRELFELDAAVRAFETTL